MAHHATPVLTDADTAVLGNRARPWFLSLLAVGGIALVLALVLALVTGQRGVERFGFAYLTGYSFCLSIVLGCLFFVTITTLFRAGWCVMVRRIAETFSACMPVMAVLFIPIAVYVFMWNGQLYPWAQDFPEGQAHASALHLQELGWDVDPQLVSDAPADQHAPAEADASHAQAPGAGTEGGHTAEPTADAGHAAAGQHGEGAEGGHGEAAEGGHEALSFMAENDTQWGWYDHALPYFVGVKAPWFTAWFWSLRWALYFLVFCWIGVGFWKLSVRQDATNDPELTNTRERWAPLSVAAFAFVLTLLSVDLLLALDPVFFSTMFAVVVFADAFTAGLAVIILTVTFLKKKGFLPNVTTDHQHDLGKLLFAFVFFWGYVSFSQFMLIWYASLPETTYWLELRGITSAGGTERDAAAPTFMSGWTYLSLFILFFHLLLPFAILLSRHVKRNATARTLMAVWMLVAVYIDFYWMVMPVFSSPEVGVGYLPIDLLTAAGLVCLTVAAAVRIGARHSLVPTGDPRMAESLKLDTNVWAPMFDH